MKMALCWESYNSNSHRKSLPINLEQLDKEITKPIWKKKKKMKPLYEIWDKLIIKSRNIKNSHIEKWENWCLWKLEVEITGKKPTKTRNMYYTGTILELFPERFMEDKEYSISIWDEITFSI